MHRRKVTDLYILRNHEERQESEQLEVAYIDSYIGKLLSK